MRRHQAYRRRCYALLGLSVALCAQVARAELAGVSPTTRWLWVAGEQKGEGCDLLIQAVNQSFIKRLSELMPVEVVSDAQTLPCRDERCLKARTVSAGATVGLSAQVTCTKQSMIIDLTVLPSDQPALKFREGMSRAAQAQKGKKRTRHPRGGATLSPHLSVTQALGMRLAQKVTMGPPPETSTPAPSPIKTGAWLSVSHEVATQAELLGGAAHLEVAHVPHDAPTVWYGTLGLEASQSDRYAQRRVVSALGGRRRLSQGRLSPVVGGCLELSYERSKGRTDQLADGLSSQGRSIFTREESVISSREELTLRPALEAGLSWRGRELELSVVTRLSPSTVVPLELSRSAWATFLGVRW